MSPLKSKSYRDSCLKKGAVLATKESNLSESEFAKLQTTQEIEERVSKSFLALDAFTTELCGSSTGNSSGTGTGGTGQSGSGGW